MPTFGDVYARPLKYVTATVADASIVGAPCRAYSLVVTLNGTATEGVLFFTNRAIADIEFRQTYRVTAESPIVVKSWGPQGLTCPDMNINTVNDCIWTIAYQEV